MNTKNILFFICVFVLSCLFYLPTFSVVNAQSESTSPYHYLVTSLNREYNEVYVQYAEISNRDSTNSDTDAFFSEFNSDLDTWDKVFSETETVYTQYLNNNDHQVSEIAYKALQANQKGKVSLNLFREAFLSNNSDETEKLLTKADSAIREASNLHDEAVDLYNNNSGYNSDLYTRNILIISSVIMGVITFMLFLKSRTNSIIQAEVIKSEIYRRLTNSALWMTVGLGVTAAGFAYSFKNGGTYYILWGPVLWGGWELLKGLVNYFKNDRKILATISEQYKEDAIRNSFGKTNQTPVPKPPITCHKCGNTQGGGSIVCKQCGENIL